MRTPILVGELELTEPINDVHLPARTTVSRTTVFACWSACNVSLSDMCRCLRAPSTLLLLRERSGGGSRARSTLSDCAMV